MSRPTRPGSALPSWSRVLVVVAHPDDETFGLGAVIDLLTRAGAEVRVLCYTRGEASTLNEIGASLRSARESELRQAGAVLGMAGVDLLDYGDGRLAAIPEAELAARVLQALASHRADGLLVFDETGITGHPDHRAATRAAVRAASSQGLPVLAWAFPAWSRTSCARRRGSHSPGSRVPAGREPSGGPRRAAPGRG